MNKMDHCFSNLLVFFLFRFFFLLSYCKSESDRPLELVLGGRSAPSVSGVGHRSTFDANESSSSTRLQTSKYTSALRAGSFFPTRSNRFVCGRRRKPRPGLARESPWLMGEPTAKNPAVACRPQREALTRKDRFSAHQQFRALRYLSLIHI